MKLYQIKEYNQYTDYRGDYSDHYAEATDCEAIFFSEDAARAYCERENLAFAEADAETQYKLAVENHRRMVVQVREHNALVAAGLRQTGKTMQPKPPKLADFIGSSLHYDRWPHLIYSELNTMDEPVS